MEAYPDYGIEIIFILPDNGILKMGEKTLRELRGPDMEDKYQEIKFESADEAAAFRRAFDLSNLCTIAPHKARYYDRYNIEWLKEEVKHGKVFRYEAFWHEGPEYKNHMLSQWYRGNPIENNGRRYVTAEQYMMSEKALLFGDLYSYRQIMNETSPKKCKELGRHVTPFDQKRWDEAAREIIFHGNLAKLQSDINVVAALLDTEDAVLLEASPYDDVYGAGLEEKDLLNRDGTLKVMPWDWHKAGSTKQAENNLGFVLMGIRDLFRELLGLPKCYIKLPEEE